jgi:hypothetical protein
MRRLTGVLVVAAGGLALGQAALAHTPYVLPVTFAPDRDYVTVEAGMAETHPFTPDFPIRTAGDFLVVGADGQPVKTAPAVNLKELTAFDVMLPAEGTYRITTGERAGRTMTWAKVAGAWRPVRPPAPSARPNAAPMRPEGEAGANTGPIEESKVPAGAETQVTQAFIKAEAYVTRGSPNKGALKPSGKGFELEPLTHPNELFVGDAFRFALTMDGKPVAAQAFTIARGGEAYSETRYAHSGKTGADGRAEVTFAQPGAYLLEIHYPERAEGNPSPVPRSTVYSLAFEVTR